MATATDHQEQAPAEPGGSTPALTLAGLAALLASACCVLPLVFALVGISGAWIARMRVLEPYSGALSVLSLAALAFAGWRLYRTGSAGGAACQVGDTACRQVSAGARRWFWLVAILALIPLLVPLAAPLFY
ncbi:MAG: merT mercuric transport family protein [Ramlibacter sp.]|nr:merT mercuric transport family protein [Ramlibacter sp.]